jgi:3-deoxy-D-manno-octulosonic-acid transferase
MRLSTAMFFYRLLLPLVFLAAFPGWVVKMLRRGGLGTRLGERVAYYTAARDAEPRGAVHLHAVSVGESLLAMKLIRAWLARDPAQRFVLATGTATGHAVATAAAIPALRVAYAPLDFPSMVRRYLDRFQPAQIILIEGEAWPCLLLACRQRKIPVALVNARLSPRSARRFQRFAAWVRPLFSLLDAVAIQEPQDAQIWQILGVQPQRIHHTGSLKFDPGSGPPPAKRPDFQQMLDRFGVSRPLILAASTHAGEDAWIASAIYQAAPAALAVIVPRHAERRAEIKGELERAGFTVVLRSKFQPPPVLAATGDGHHVFLIDSTGELRDWTAHADVVIIGKSFLATGGQTPAEAIIANKPVIFGPHMENFQPLAGRLVAAHGCLQVHDQPTLARAITTALDPAAAGPMTRNAAELLGRHHGATQRILDLLGAPATTQK